MNDGSTVSVKLSPGEMMMSALAGVMREVHAVNKGRQDTKTPEGKVRTGWQNHAEGCLAEMAVAKWLGVYWNPDIGGVGKGDVGEIEVRATAVESYRLTVFDDDPGDKPVVSVVGEVGKYTLRGWVFGHEGKTPEYKKQAEICKMIGGANFVATADLRPMSELDGWESHPDRIDVAEN